MDFVIRGYQEKDLPDMVRIWNEVVEDARAFPQERNLDIDSGRDFFAGQSYCGVAANECGGISGLYILHPNNVGRCSHICNASFAVAKNMRGRGIGRKLVTDCLEMALKTGFGVMQFNAVAISNLPAHKLYQDLGFQKLGIVPGGFRRKDGSFEDICLYFYDLKNWGSQARYRE